jgi:FkbM family methyltransferase
VLEVGAWIGPFTRYATLKQAKRVIAFEPAPDNAECFRRNFAEEIQDGRVTLIEAAAWRASGEVEMQKAGSENFYGTTEGYNIVPHGEFKVRALTIDEVVRDLGLERVDVINMDIEGAERHALEGARETIRRFAPRVVVCIHHRPDDAAAILPLMQEIRPEYRVRRDSMHARYD